MRTPSLRLKTQIVDRITKGVPAQVWTPLDFLDLGPRDAVDKVLQRLARGGDLRRVDRGLYDRPKVNRLTGKPKAPDYRAIIDAIARRDQARMLVDGMTAANDLGLTDAVPGRVVVHTDARRRSIRFNNLTIAFRVTAPSKLFWAGHPAMRLVQALHWLRGAMSTRKDRHRILKRLKVVLADPEYGVAMRTDLTEHMPKLPAWMQNLLRDLLALTGDRREGGEYRRTSDKKIRRNQSRKEGSTYRGKRRAHAKAQREQVATNVVRFRRRRRTIS